MKLGYSVKKYNTKAIVARGIKLAEEGAIHVVDIGRYMVGAWEVSCDGQGWMCSCPFYRYRRIWCKHIYAVMYVEGMLDNTIQLEAE